MTAHCRRGRHWRAANAASASRRPIHTEDAVSYVGGQPPCGAADAKVVIHDMGHAAFAFYRLGDIPRRGRAADTRDYQAERVSRLHHDYLPLASGFHQISRA